MRKMKFENIKLTEQQRVKLFAKKIKHPYGSFEQITEGIKPLYLTFDKDSGNWLAECYQHHDTNEIILEFLFMYENTPYPVQAWKVREENKIIWRLARIKPEQICDSAFLEALTEAFKTYSESDNVAVRFPHPIIGDICPKGD